MTHIWLLSAGEPREESELPDFLARRLTDPHVLRVPGWLSSLAVWFYTWLHLRKLTPTWRMLPGPSPADDALQEQSVLLQRSLGGKYSCRAVFRYRSPDASEVAAGIGRGERVVLLPLLPHRGPALYSAMSAATVALQARGADIATITSYPSHAGYVDALAETVRAALADLARQHPAHQTRYQVLFSAVLPTGPSAILTDTRSELEQTVAAVVAAVGLARPHQLGFTATLTAVPKDVPSTAVQLAGLSSGSAAVVVPLGEALESAQTQVSLDQKLGTIAAEAEVVFVRAETVSARPTFTRALCDLVREAEAAAGWRKDAT
ncbi:MAG: ferrochelatase [Myxococcota bacterium]|nr:ferrochelatase [Myxococcota bacterium]